MRAIRLAAAALMVIALTGARPTAVSAARKDVRAVLVFGKQVENPRISEHPAMLLVAYDQYSRTQEWPAGAKTPTLTGRGCVGVAVFTRSGKSAMIPLDRLAAGDADITFWVYPASKGEPSAMVYNGVWPLNDFLLRAFEMVGYKRDESSESCQRPGHFPPN